MPSLRRGLAPLLCLLTPALTTFAFAVDDDSPRVSPVVRAVRRVAASVVNIQSEKMADGSRGWKPDSATARVNGLGTGVVIDERGYILTNQHVVDRVLKLNVHLSNGRSHVAQLIAVDTASDLAVIKIDAGVPLTPIQLGVSYDLMIGEPVVAVGNAYGYEHTVTTGIISALDRSVKLFGEQYHHHLIQTDASINPGNSGGPLMNIQGDVIGLNVAIRAGAQGIGFAIPIDEVKRIASDLMSTRRLRQTWHGLTYDPAPLDVGQGIRIERAEGAGLAGGLRAGDRVLRVADRSVMHGVDLERHLLDVRPGQTVPLSIVRDGERRRVELTMASLAGSEGPETLAGEVWSGVGLKLVEVEKAAVQRHQAQLRGGMLVREVRSGSPADQARIRSGDILVGLHEWETLSLKNVQNILHRPEISTISPLRYYILRAGELFQGTIALPALSAAR